jgi:hypothetical protein
MVVPERLPVFSPRVERWRLPIGAGVTFYLVDDYPAARVASAPSRLRRGRLRLPGGDAGFDGWSCQRSSEARRMPPTSQRSQLASSRLPERRNHVHWEQAECQQHPASMALRNSQ